MAIFWIIFSMAVNIFDGVNSQGTSRVRE